MPLIEKTSLYVYREIHEQPEVLARLLAEEGLAKPILLGNPEIIGAKARHIGLDLKSITVLDPTPLF